MRSCILALFGAVLVLTLTFSVSAPAASAGPTTAELQQQLLELSEQVAGLKAEVDSLRARLQEADEGAPAGAPPADDELADLIAAAERDAAVEEAPEESDQAAFTSGALGLQALNPEISVTGDFISSYGSGDGVTARFDNTVRTLGLHFESYLDPYSRFGAAVPVLEDEAKLGEAYFTRYGWLPNLNVTLGKFRQQFGVVNRWHKHSLDQVDFPLPLRQVFGPGGLNQTGFSVEWQMPPLGDSTQELTLQLTDGENGRVFGGNGDRTPSFLAHYKNYRDLSEDAYLEAGLSALVGRNDAWNVLSGDEVLPHEKDLQTTILGADLTFLWEPSDNMRYENTVWRTEAYLVNKDILAPDGSGEDTLRSWGAYSYYQKRLDRTHDAGIRIDYYEPDAKEYADIPGLSLAPLAVTAPGAHQWLFAPYVTWAQSPWVHWRLEYNRLASHDMGPDEDAVFLQCIFAAGPHKHERY